MIFEWKNAWPSPPIDDADMYVWRVYCRVWNDVGCPTPGSCIVAWFKKGLVSDDEDEFNLARAAIYHYLTRCNE